MLNVPHSIVNPSILFDELEIKRANRNKEKLPEYPAPAPTPPKKDGSALRHLCEGWDSEATGPKKWA
jgi:hypothetical protein